MMKNLLNKAKKIINIGDDPDNQITIWSEIEGLPDVVPVKPGHHFMPDWFVKAPTFSGSDASKEPNNKGTIRRCPSFVEFMSMGFTVPLWTDLYVKIYDDGAFEWKTPSAKFQFHQHPSQQYSDYLPEHEKQRTTLVLKPDCPWRIKTPPGVSVLQLPMLFHFNPFFTVIPGTIWTDIHYEINQQMVFHKRGEFRIQRGTPLATYIPIRRENFSHTVRNATKEDTHNSVVSAMNIWTKFTNGYQTHQTEIKKCPFHKDKK